ncbi:two-component sensor histidine kinase [Massilia sp. Dwa41.01b]|uniref:ATP-binding protein n=1 Tax=unclassified Massilia TaxID=2609279 RepID=UPI0016018CA6|nr:MULTISPECIES: ATP-binding protein [unclassified Massilia]QNA88708.1 two-component sensor histidine kinase [Massilia sp. Dwa41.01b]QNA99607.1 two-component sensor histidine kinase [Massilia sp. Se16.2.3]
MKTLRLRLLFAIGASFALFWTLSSIWTLVDLRSEFRDALDERLAASARMVAALVVDTPALTSRPVAQRLAPSFIRTDGVACEIRLLRGGILGRTRNSPDLLGMTAPGFRTRTIDGVIWRSYTIEQNGVRITTADRTERRAQLFHNIAFATFVPFLIAMAATLIALWFAIRRCLRPLERIRSALAARAPDALQPLSVESLPGELAPLVSTVNTLLAQIERTIERERRFTGDAAHELRTPLTAVKTHLQVARLSGPGPDGRVALDRAEQGVLRLQSMIEQLLMLARVEGSVSFEEDDQLDARTVVEHVITQLPAASAQMIRIIDEGGADRTLRIPASLAMTALRNLLDNALRYGPADAPVVLRIHSAGQGVAFSVEDQGDGLSDADIARAGNRFWRKGGGQGSGLGLSIVRAIVSRYQGSWELTRGSGGGMIARLTLPAN